MAEVRNINDLSNVKRKIYIVLSQTGTILSRILKTLSGDAYNHASIALDVELNDMFSFGRKNPYNPWVGGFVKESLYSGTFKRFKATQAVIIELETDADKYEAAKKQVKNMYINRKNYNYNVKGLFAAFFGKTCRQENHFYCSEFVNDVLVKNNIIKADMFSGIIHPIDFLKIPQSKIIYTGMLAEYPL